MTKPNIDSEQASSFFVQLYQSINYWKINSKNIADIIKHIKIIVKCLLE